MSAVNSQWSIDEPYWNLLNASVRPGSEGSIRAGGILGRFPKMGRSTLDLGGSSVNRLTSVGFGVADKSNELTTDCVSDKRVGMCVSGLL